jgi:hypothetical protein
MNSVEHDIHQCKADDWLFTPIHKQQDDDSLRQRSFAVIAYKHGAVCCCSCLLLMSARGRRKANDIDARACMNGNMYVSVLASTCAVGILQ